LKPELLQKACADAGIALQLNLREGYDHSYYFISTFMADHLRWHAERLR
jgi:S-formylglutathione hydrolase